MADKLINKRKRKLWIVLGSIALVLAILIGACAIYLMDYYRADWGAIEAFAPADAVQMQTLDNGNIVFAPENATQGFIFYPGGKVEHKAYIPLMQALAEKGVLCVITEMLFNLAVFDVNAADGIQEQYPQIEEWYIGGHSLGGSMAASYLADHTDEYEGLVLLGAYSIADLSDSGLAVLSVYGSEDKVMNREKYADNKANLPDDFTEVVIDGGSHAYFGMYGAQDGDGIPAITGEEQINFTADKIFEMINGSKDSEKSNIENETNDDGSSDSEPPNTNNGDKVEAESSNNDDIISSSGTQDQTSDNQSSQEKENTVTEASFTKQNFRSEDCVMNYWLYAPKAPQENLPLIVYLHGGSGKGDDLELITAVDGFPQYVRDLKISPNAYILIPQLSSNHKGWSDIKADLMKLITAFAKENKVDESKICLTGHSMGGTGVWQLAMAYPKTFSAIAPMSGSVKLTNENLQKLKNMRVWAFVGEEDKIVDPSISVDFIQSLMKINDNANITVLTETDHFTVPKAYLSDEYDLIDWLIT